MDILTIDAAAEYLSISKGTLRIWIKEEKAPRPLRIGGRGGRVAVLAFYKQDIEELKRVRETGLIK